ncbi:glycoside hydrolase family 81 protein [Chaetomium tenue]|uniref:Glycoside hydrolase family 81 protein n=1 Tax=Chaetomium tenue TaxID=1854479 RepID=A0ACB7PJK2_9PEZI|nr:glycoside hydrolase family 81 protein [Chaetomium globosum]
MERIWRLLFALLTALQFTTSVASPVYLAQQTPPHAALTKSVTIPGPHPTPNAPNAIHRDARSTSTPLPRPKRNWNDPPSREVLTSPAKVITSVGPSGTAQVLASKKTPATGFIPSILDTVGHVTSVPLLTKPIPKPTSLLAAVSVVVSLKISPSISVKMTARDIFADPISTDAPPGNIGRKQDHPVPRLGIQGKGPFETNKFYGNFHRGNQTSPTYLHPYSVAWVRGQGASGSWGLAVSHVEAHQRVYGQASPVTGAVSYFINPIGIHSVCLSAKELGSDTVLTSEGLTDFSIQVALRPTAQADPAVQFPLVQGVSFITAIYNGANPVLQTGVFFRTVTRMTTDPKPGITKYKLQLEDGATWLVYARHTQGDPLDLEVVNNGLAQAKGPFYGTIQVAKDPGDGEKVYDQACGAYPVGVQLSGSVDGAKGTYHFTFKKAGMTDTALAMFALPHHQSSFDDATRGKLTDLKLQTTTKGIATAILADCWTMGEPNLPTNIGFLPWSPQAGSVSAISNATRQVIHNIAQQEVSQNIIQQLDENSMYFSGKALAKFASLILSIQELLGDQGLAQAGLTQLKVAFSRFAQNAQKYPLVYESGWGGVVSSATYVTGDPYVDFGNTMYNDHHFHWGYFIYTAAVIGHLDPSWINDNKAYVNMLVRDVANPSTQDQYFPLWRCFDWFHGHSWAHGLSDTLDGNDQESSSEDTMHAYALKMWGSITGDKNLEARGNLMLSIQARSMQAYYLYTSSNTVQPSTFIGNKVAGILFENKIDHTTYFGNRTEDIQGIHMLPLLPHTPLVRTPAFVREEWDTYFSGGREGAITGGWKGVVWGNYATVDPRGAYAFFAGEGFDPAWLDGGASLTWYLCYSAALGGL